jgi:hypothetical protein
MVAQTTTPRTYSSGDFLFDDTFDSKPTQKRISHTPRRVAPRTQGKTQKRPKITSNTSKTIFSDNLFDFV